MEKQEQRLQVRMSMNICGISTIEQAVAIKADGLSKLRKETSHNVVKSLVMKEVGKLNTFFAESKALRVEQVELIADFIMADFWTLMVHEITFILEQGVKGKYGDLYGALDVNVVYKWFEQYYIARAELFETNNIAKHNRQMDKFRKEVQ